MEVQLESIDYCYDIMSFNDVVNLSKKLNRIEINYTIAIGEHELEGLLKLSPSVYKEFKSDEEIIEYIKTEITGNIK